MARKARIHVPGIIQHIMARGIEGKEIFADSEDRETFLEILAASLSIAGHKCYAWVLMSNHYHLLLRSSEDPLGIMMRRLNSKYARYFSSKYNRRGYLFQDRYKSIATQDQNYIEELVRYIHLNPYRSNNCTTIEELDRYPWSGHASIMGVQTSQFQDVETVLKRFSGSRELYRTFIQEGIANGAEEGFINTIRRSNEGCEDVRNAGCWVIGDSEFVRNVLLSDANRRARVARYQKEGFDISRLAEQVGEKAGIRADEIRKRTKDTTINEARKIFSYIGSKMLEMPKSELGKYFGISTAGVWRLAHEGRKVVEKRGMEFTG